MTTPGTFETLGLSLSAWQPNTTTPGSYIPRGQWLFDLCPQIAGYGHEIRADGGYWSAQTTIRDSKSRIEEWISRGLGRHVEVYNSAQVRVWEGFVNQIDAVLGPLSVTRGPLLDSTTRVYVSYTPVDYSIDPPARGATTVLGPYNDAAAQALYGIITCILTSGAETAGGAAQAAQTYLAENRYPRTTKRLSEGGDLQVTLHLLGYVHLLDAFPYARTGVTGTTTIATAAGGGGKINRVLLAEPNGLFSDVNAALDVNATLVVDQDDDQGSGYAIVKALVALGDAAYNRYTFGIYGGREARYQAVDRTTVSYHYAEADPGERMTTPGGAIVRPWDVQPARWAMYTDFLAGRTIPTTNLAEDPRMKFIEIVRYTAPYGLSLDGGRVDTAGQMLARQGLRGI